VAFSNFFDGYFVVHSKTINPERFNKFSVQLERAGVSNFEIITPKNVSDDDPRLKYYTGDARRLLSLIDCFEAAITIAESRNLNSIAVFEDDIKFRHNFLDMWNDVEHNISTKDWEILLLHRIEIDPNEPIIEDAKKPIDVINIQGSLRNHCILIHSRAYRKFRRSLQQCVEMGYPADFFSGLLDGGVHATTKNLTGQAGGLTSSLQKGIIGRTYFRMPLFHIEFGCYRSRWEYAIVKKARALRKTLENTLQNQPPDRRHNK
jgi:hypothetical protein